MYLCIWNPPVSKVGIVWTAERVHGGAERPQTTRHAGGYDASIVATSFQHSHTRFLRFYYWCHKLALFSDEYAARYPETFLAKYTVTFFTLSKQSKIIQWRHQNEVSKQAKQDWSSRYHLLKTNIRQANPFHSPGRVSPCFYSCTDYKDKKDQAKSIKHYSRVSHVPHH